jgi:hypothetical protein
MSIGRSPTLKSSEIAGYSVRNSLTTGSRTKDGAAGIKLQRAARHSVRAVSLFFESRRYSISLFYGIPDGKPLRTSPGIALSAPAVTFFPFPDISGTDLQTIRTYIALLPGAN